MPRFCFFATTFSTERFLFRFLLALRFFFRFFRHIFILLHDICARYCHFLAFTEWFISLLPRRVISPYSPAEVSAFCRAFDIESRHFHFRYRAVVRWYVYFHSITLLFSQSPFRFHAFHFRFEPLLFFHYLATIDFFFFFALFHFIVAYCFLIFAGLLHLI